MNIDKRREQAPADGVLLGEKKGTRIYKYSSDRYDPQETWFPGFEVFDGTVEGTMQAGMKAYPL